MMSLFYRSTLLLLLFNSIIYSQEAEPPPEAISTAREILSKLHDKYMKGDGYNITFLLVNKTPAGKQDTITGNITFKGKNYRIETEDIIVCSDGTTQWTYFNSTGEVQITKTSSEHSENSSNPYMLINDYENNFRFFTENTKEGIATIKFAPLNPKLHRFHTARLKVNTNSLNLISLTIYMKDGNQVIYIIKNTKKLKEVPDSTFVFDVSKAKEVIDLR